jgi:radical SAM-linked protein
VGEVIYKAWQAGARFDEWADKFNFEIWTNAIKECGLDLDFYVYRERPKDEIFPWDHLIFGQTKEALYADYIKGINETADASPSFNANDMPLENFHNDFNELQPPLPPQMCVRLRFSKTGDVKFISHLEHVEALRRAIRRSGLDIAFTGGFSPQIKASFGPPLIVGYESFCEYIDLSLASRQSLPEIKDAINKTLPTGYNLLEVKKIPLIFPSIEALVNMQEWRIKNFGLTKDEIDAFLNQDKIIITKKKAKKDIEVDARPLIHKLYIKDDDLILMLTAQTGKTLKPELIVRAICPPKNPAVLEIQRLNLYIKTPAGKIYPI